jgi:acyl carrier protein
MDLHEQLRAYIADRFLFDPQAKIEPDQSLMRSGVLDSTGAMDLVMYLEDTFKIKVADAELVPQNLDSINNLASFVQRKAGVNAGR